MYIIFVCTVSQINQNLYKCFKGYSIPDTESFHTFIALECSQLSYFVSFLGSIYDSEFLFMLFAQKCKKCNSKLYVSFRKRELVSMLNQQFKSVNKECYCMYITVQLSWWMIALYILYIIVRARTFLSSQLQKAGK